MKVKGWYKGQAPEKVYVAAARQQLKLSPPTPEEIAEGGDDPAELAMHSWFRTTVDAARAPLLARIAELEAEVAQLDRAQAATDLRYMEAQTRRDQARGERDDERRKVEVLLNGDKALGSRIWLGEEVGRLRAELAEARAAAEAAPDGAG